jgi:Mg/Co/Ni transporter MgtE
LTRGIANGHLVSIRKVLPWQRLGLDSPVFEMIRVGDVMDRQAPTIPAKMTVGELSDRIAKGDPAVSKRQGLLIVDTEQKLAGIITRGDLLRALQNVPAGDIEEIVEGFVEDFSGKRNQ